MTSSTLDATPATTTVAGAVSNGEIHVHPSRELRDASYRAADPNYFDWLDHVRAAAACTRPVLLRGEVLTTERSTGRVLRRQHTDDLPDGVIYKPCGNRRATVCPACSTLYQSDAYQLVRAGLIGGKGVPESVAEHPAAFVTFTAPSFGPVHNRHVSRHTCTRRRHCDCRADVCRPRRNAAPCPHGKPTACFARHELADSRIGQPLCLDCYDHEHQVVWNLAAGELWRRTKQAIERHLATIAHQRGIPNYKMPNPDGKTHHYLPPVRVSHGKAAEFQARGAVHFHALIRMDGIDPTDPTAIVPPPDLMTAADLEDAIRAAAAQVAHTTPPHPDQPTGWLVVWGDQLDVQHITLSGDGEVTDSMVAGYIAKYATKSTEATGHTSARITGKTITVWANHDTHTGRLIAACWRLGRDLPTHDDQGDATNPYTRLRRWAHMLGFGGHFLTKARRYSTTFGKLRGARTTYRRAAIAHITQPDHTADPYEETTLVIGHLTYSGTGWHNAGDALLANTAAAQARERRRAGRDALTTTPSVDMPPSTASRKDPS